MASGTIRQISKEEIKEAIVDLIKENNAEFRQLLNDLMPKTSVTTKKKQKQNSSPKIVKKERVAYQEMPFWKAHPELKPLDATKFAVQKEDFYALQTLFQEPDCPPIEEWIAELD